MVNTVMFYAENAANRVVASFRSFGVTGAAPPAQVD
jgi:hypothetical protein